MVNLYWVVAGIFIAIVIIGILITAFALKRRRKHVDYFAIFIMGFIWFVAGVPLRIWSLVILGGLFALIGLANHDEWGKNRVAWKDLHRHDRTLRIIASVFLILLLVFGIVFYLILQ